MPHVEKHSNIIRDCPPQTSTSGKATKHWTKIGPAQVACAGLIGS